MTRDERKKWAQMYLAKLLKMKSIEEVSYKGSVSYSTILNWKTGRRVPNEHAMDFMKRIFGNV